MRQITDEFRPNPFLPIRTQGIAAPDMSTGNEAAIHKVWLRNKYVERAT